MNFKIQQCGYGNSSSIIANSLYNTDKCDRISTNCVDFPSRGFKLDTYECECKSGFYKPFKQDGKVLSCLKCSDGCEICQGLIIIK